MWYFRIFDWMNLVGFEFLNDYKSLMGTGRRPERPAKG